MTMPPTKQKLYFAVPLLCRLCFNQVLNVCVIGQCAWITVYSFNLLDFYDSINVQSLVVAAGTLHLSKLIPGLCLQRRAKKCLHFSELNSSNTLLPVKANTKSIVKEGIGVFLTGSLYLKK